MPKSLKHVIRSIVINEHKGNVKEGGPGSGPQYKVGDHVVPSIGPHKGQKHKVIHVHASGEVNISPSNKTGKQNKYHMGAAKAQPQHLKPYTQNESLEEKRKGIVPHWHKMNVKLKKSPVDAQGVTLFGVNDKEKKIQAAKDAEARDSQDYGSDDEELPTRGHFSASYWAQSRHNLGKDIDKFGNVITGVRGKGKSGQPGYVPPIGLGTSHLKKARVTHPLPIVREELQIDEWTISDVERAMKKRGNVDQGALQKLKKLQHMGNVTRDHLTKVGHGKLQVEANDPEQPGQDNTDHDNKKDIVKTAVKSAQGKQKKKLGTADQFNAEPETRPLIFTAPI